MPIPSFKRKKVLLNAVSDNIIVCEIFVEFINGENVSIEPLILSRLMRMTEKRESGRVKEVQQRRVLDESSRIRRQRKILDALEEDNFQDDPHADLKMNKRAPKFEETNEGSTNRTKKRKIKSDHFKQRFRKNFVALLEEEQMSGREAPNYTSAGVGPSNLPHRHFCAVCGFPSNYTCVSCGARYCAVKCLGTHRDTRCLKWIA